MCFGGGGGSSSSSTSNSNVNVEVNPEINVANIVDLKPVEKLIDHLAGAEQERAAASDRAAVLSAAATKADIDSRAGLTDTLKILAVAAAIGGAVMLARKR